MREWRRASTWERVVWALVAVIAAAVVTWLVRLVANDTMYVFFVAAVALASWIGGVKIGIGAMLASIVVVDVAFIGPVGGLGPFSTAAIAQLLSFALVALIMVLLTDALVVAKRRAERLARAADRAKAEAEAESTTTSDFLATLSHEVRTPINALLGYADLLEAGAGGAVNDTQAEFIARLRQAARHLLTVVNRVLDIAKADSGRLAVDMSPTLVAPVIDAAVSVLLPQAQARRIALTIDRNADGSGFCGDGDRVREIMVNLLGNAVKFSPDGSAVKVTIAHGGDGRAPPALHDAASPIRIVVTDCGPGIAPSDQQRIFEPFVQSSGARVKGQQGTGLGLAISRRLARLMGGDLTVESVPGSGASFSLWLRSAETQASRRARGRSAVGAQRTAGGTQGVPARL